MPFFFQKQKIEKGKENKRLTIVLIIKGCAKKSNKIDKIAMWMPIDHYIAFKIYPRLFY